MKHEKITDNSPKRDDENEPHHPPGAPDRTPVENPVKKKNKPMGDPQPPEKKKKRM